MSCFLSLERTKSALLVIDLGRAKELHFCIEKSKNCVGKKINDFPRTTWDKIRACEEEKEFEEIQQILKMEINYTSILVFAFDHEGFLYLWVLNEDLVSKRVDAISKTFFSLITQLLGIVNVNINRNSSFLENASVANTTNRVNSPLRTLSRKPQARGALKKIVRKF